MKAVFSIIIIIFVSAAVFAEAYAVMSVTLNQGTSNLTIARGIIENVELRALARNEDMPEPINPQSQSTQTPVATPCPTPSVVEGSLMDFLRRRNLPNTYQYRLQLASTYGMTEYTGTGTQNAYLLSLLRDQQAFRLCEADFNALERTNENNP